MGTKPTTRAILAALLVTLTIGCGGGGDDGGEAETGSVDIYWSFRREAPAQTSGEIIYDASHVGTPSGPCAESAVEKVQVLSPVGDATVDCVQADGLQRIRIDGVPAGTQYFTVRGLRGSTTVYASTGVGVDVVAGTTTDHYLELDGISAPLELIAWLSYGDELFYATCAAASNPLVSYTVFDRHGNDVFSNSVWCLAPEDGFPVMDWNFELDDYRIRLIGFTGHPSAQRTFDSCLSDAQKTFDVSHLASQRGVNAVHAVLHTPPRCAF